MSGEKRALSDFERTYLGKLRLAAEVILGAAPDLELVSDPLEVELGIFRDRLEFLLLLPEGADQALPWRKMINGQTHPGKKTEGEK